MQPGYPGQGQDPYGQQPPYQDPYGQPQPGQQPPYQDPYAQPPAGQQPPYQDPYAQPPAGQQPPYQDPYAQPPAGQQPPYQDPYAKPVSGNPYQTSGSPYQTSGSPYPAPEGMYGQAPAYQTPGYGPGYAPVQQNNTLGILALIFGILSIPLTCCYLGIPLGIAGAVCGGIGIKKANEGTAGNKGMSLAGLICGIVGFVLSIVLISLGVAGSVFNW